MNGAHQVVQPTWVLVELVELEATDRMENVEVVFTPCHERRERTRRARPTVMPATPARLVIEQDAVGATATTRMMAAIRKVLLRLDTRDRFRDAIMTDPAVHLPV